MPRKLRSEDVVLSWAHFYSDRGSRYCKSCILKNIKKNKQMKNSMSRKVDCWHTHNLAESFFGNLKRERVLGSGYYYIREEVRKDVIGYIEMFYSNSNGAIPISAI